MAIDHEALLQTFLNEAEEGFALMETGLMTLEELPDDRESLTTVFRTAHSFKGNAGIFGFIALADLAHGLEDVLDQLRDGELRMTRELATFLLGTVDALREMVQRAVGGDNAMQPAEVRMLERLREIGAGEASAGASPQGAEASTGSHPVEPPPIKPPLIEPPSIEAASIAKPSPPQPSLPEQPSSQSERPSQERSRAQSKPLTEVKRHATKTLRVDLDKLDRLLNLAGEIGIARGRLTQMLENPEVGIETVLEAHREADFLQMELQELVMKVRMVPVGPTFRYYTRVVRDLAQANGKEARLEIEGEDVEVDAAVIEHLRDPLTHMIRNALDHGIEYPEVRRGRGKDSCGQMKLRAFHAAGTIVIELSDDGSGLDRRRILERGKNLGLVGAGEILADREIDQLIFEPGFSTAQTVTDLSGRGVGMDVVRRNIEAIRGTVAVYSRPREGTTLSIRLPLTLAIIEGFMVGVDEEVYIIPLDAVTETTALLENGDLRRASRGADRGVLDLRGMPLPYVRLRDALGLVGRPPSRESVVVVRSDSGSAGLVVDMLYGETQTVIKPLSRLFRQVRGISGSSILGNGQVAFILDVPDLLRRELEREAHLGARTEWKRDQQSVSLGSINHVE